MTSIQAHEPTAAAAVSGQRAGLCAACCAMHITVGLVKLAAWVPSIIHARKRNRFLPGPMPGLHLREQGQAMRTIPAVGGHFDLTSQWQT